MTTDAVAADFSTKPTLTGDKVVLRPFLSGDLPAMLAALRDPEVLRLTGVTAPEAADDAAQRASAWYATRNEQTDRLDLAVVDRATQTCVGEVVLNDWNPANRSCGFRTLLGAAGRDRGLGTESARMIIGYGFEQLRLHRIELEVYAFNPRARRVYDKIGFVPEGVRRDALRDGDSWVDATVMSILAPEWARHRGNP